MRRCTEYVAGDQSPAGVVDGARGLSDLSSVRLNVAEDEERERNHE